MSETGKKISRYDNVDIDILDGVMTIRIQLDEEVVNVQPSSSGKTLVLATTGGARPVGDRDLKLNLTVYRKPRRD
ncbi:MAG: hypothetical protein KAY24_00290 [Candidatus Eisenbacteria sp.]|nr:hypothetical protein [Candidatus Eisenbacteria bacterium]